MRMMTRLWNNITTKGDELFPVYRKSDFGVYEKTFESLWMALGHLFWINIGHDIKDELK